jgi:hypothetical protein
MAKVVRLNEGQLRKLVRRVLRENVVGDGSYQLHVLPKRDEFLDEIIEHIGAFRQVGGTLWPVLLNGGNRIDDPSDPFYGHYAIGFDDQDDMTAEDVAHEFKAEIKHLIVELNPKHTKAVSLLGTMAMQLGLKTQADVSDALDEILDAGMHRLPPPLRVALDELLKDENNLVRLIFKNMQSRQTMVAPTTGPSAPPTSGDQSYEPIGYDRHRDPRSSM